MIVYFGGILASTVVLVLLLLFFLPMFDFGSFAVARLRPLLISAEVPHWFLLLLGFGFLCCLLSVLLIAGSAICCGLTMVVYCGAVAVYATWFRLCFLLCLNVFFR